MNILIVGKAKTGTTIISKSIQKSMPGRPAYFLEPKSEADLEKIAADGTADRVVKIIYEHWAGDDSLRRKLETRDGALRFDKVVFIVRDIRDEMISRLLYVAFPRIRHGRATKPQLKQWVAAVREKERHPGEMSFLDLCARYEAIFGDDFVAAFLRNEAETTLDYLDLVARSAHDKVVVKYEDFVAGSLDGLAAHLGFSVAVTSDLDGLERTRRSESYDNWKTVFTAADVDFFREALGPQLKRSGYSDWSLAPVGRLPAEHFSGYVSRLIRGAGGGA